MLPPSRPQRRRRPPDRGDEGDGHARRGPRLHTELLVTRDLRKHERQFDSPTCFRCLPCNALSECQGFLDKQVKAMELIVQCMCSVHSAALNTQKKAEIKCDRRFPCGRCCKISLRCAPPLESYLVSPQEALATAGVASPLLELVFRTSQPARMAQAWLDVFHHWLERGRIDLGIAQATLRRYRARSRRLGSDLTFGAAGAMAQALGFTSVDLEEPDELAYTRAPLSSASASASAAASASAGSGGGTGSAPSPDATAAADAQRFRGALEGSATWRYSSGPGLPANSVVYLSCLTGAHTVVLAAASELEAPTAREMEASLEKRRTLLSLLYAGCVLFFV